MSSTQSLAPSELHDFGVKHVTKGVGRITEGIMKKGEGSYVVYDDGRRMLDFTCGIGVTNLGMFYLYHILKFGDFSVFLSFISVSVASGRTFLRVKMDFSGWERWCTRQSRYAVSSTL